MPDSGLVAGNSQNQPGGITPHSRSKFPLSYIVWDTHRFGEYHPHYVFEGVPSDENVNLRSDHDVRSFTLKAPLMNDINMKKDYFMVPCEAILPLNWDKWYKNPVLGGDVNDNVGLGVANYWSLVGSRFNALWNAVNTQINTTSWTINQFCTAFFRFLIFGEMLYSDGSLFTSLGFHGGTRVKCVETGAGSKSYDQFFDAMLTSFIGAGVTSFNLNLPDGAIYNVILDGSPLDDTATNPQVRIHDCLELMRDNPFGITGVTGVAVAPLTAAIKTDWSSWTVVADTVSGVPQSLKRLWAYQLVCSHFYTNDHIDYVYSAQLYREYVDHIVRIILDAKTASVPTFTLNGLKYYYDAMSAYYFEYIMSSSVFDVTSFLITTVSTANSLYIGISSYLCALYSYRRSLRFTDYFTGSRSHPLAVGDVNIDVNTGTPNYVSVIDVTKHIQMQRFFNAINRARSDIKGYVKELFGVDQAPDYHNPFYLGHTSDVVFGSEVENTGADQLTQANSVTSVLRSNGSRFSFKFDCDRECVILGLTWYDIPRAYTRTFERQGFQLSRFDLFNPFMQFTGDQPIYLSELNPNPNISSTLSPFSYTNKDMEFKQRYNQAFGAFVKFLPSWLFVADLHRRFSRTGHISPDYIRSFNSELDDFYVSLTGYSLGSYFHFIVRNVNDSSASRPMAYNPSIL